MKLGSSQNSQPRHYTWIDANSPLIPLHDLLHNKMKYGIASMNQSLETMIEKNKNILAMEL